MKKLATLTLPWVAGLVVLPALSIDGQQVLEIDFTTGRAIIDDEWRSMGSHLMAVDWSRNILYVDDDEEPDGIMAFSLETGDWLRTVPTPRGDGPREFPRTRTGMDVAPNGGLYISGYLRMIEFDSQGVPIDSWAPRIPTSTTVCNFGSAPAVPTQGGVVRRTADGTEEGIGPIRAQGRLIDAETPEETIAISLRLINARIACTEDRAYVVLSYPNGPDSVFVYDRSGKATRLAIPVGEIEGQPECRSGGVQTETGRVIQPAGPCSPWSHKAYPSFDDHENVILLSIDSRIHGAIIDPDTGCHALIRATTGNRYIPVRIYQDSALVFRSSVQQGTYQGRTIDVVDLNSSNGVSMHPLRRVSGEPCPGMLPSVTGLDSGRPHAGNRNGVAPL